MSNDQLLREHVLYLLRGGGAHAGLEQAIDGLPKELRGSKTEGIPHTPWRLLEHLRVCQWDILEYSRDPNHVSPKWPDGCWPQGDAPPSDDAWNNCVEEFRRDLQAMQGLVADPDVDLLTPIRHGKEGHTILREALLLADHNAYHLGQLIFLRRALGAWID